jgi:chemotaxis protein MotC
MKRRRLPSLAFASAALIGVGVDARCQERPQEPFELARALRSVQDRIARGDTAAFLAYRTSLSQLAEQLGRARGEAWKDPRNVRAAIAVVLSGGDPGLLTPLVALVAGQELTLVRAALAYGQNHNAEAAELLADVDARKLDPSVAGHVALVQAELAAKKDREKALALLADARLLAPGTMIEEAALRREAALAVEGSDANRFETSTMQYVRRFTNSVHMGNFRRQFAVDVATRGMADDPARRSRLEATLSSLPGGQQQDIYLSVAWEGLKGGGVDVVRWAAANAARLADEDSAQRLRSRLCEAAVLIVTDEFDKGLSTLQSLPPDRLNNEEADLLAAALRVAAQVRREPKPLDANGERPRGATEPAIAATVKSALARVDNVLDGDRK